MEKKRKAGLVVLIIGLVIIIIDLLSASSIDWNLSMSYGLFHLWFYSVLFWLIIGIIPAIIGLVYLVRK